MIGWIVAAALLVVLLVVLGRLKYKARVQMHESIEGVVEESTIVVDDQKARAIDPNNPPKWMTWRGVDGRLNCTCHSLPIRTDDRVLLWPIPGHPDGGSDLFCERTVKEAQGE